MKRILAILILSLLVVGCTSHTRSAAPPESFAPRSTRPGYLSAFPDKPYAINLDACRPGPPFRRTSYARGWHDGYHTGRNDERQRD